MPDGATWVPRDIRDAFFPVELRPVYSDNAPNKSAKSGKIKRLPRHLAVTDVDRNEAFAVVSRDYKLVTNEEAYVMAKSAISKVFNILELKDLVCLNITMPESRSFCHIDLIHRQAKFEPWEEDEWSAFLRITNSYNKMRSLRYELGFCRWICLNGMIFGAKSIEISYAHTKREMRDVERFKDNIGDIKLLEAELIEQLHQLKRYYVPEDEMLPLFCQIFDIKIDNPEKIKEKRLEQIQEMKSHIKKIIRKHFDGVGPNGYAALNVLTDFASRPVGYISSAIHVNGFQQKASNWMRIFITQISKPTFTFKNYIDEKYRISARNLENIPDQQGISEKCRSVENLY